MSSAPDKPTLRGERVLVRPAEERDVPALVALLAEPEVHRWWGENDADDVRSEHLRPGYVIERDGAGGWRDGLYMELITLPG